MRLAFFLFSFLVLPMAALAADCDPSFTRYFSLIAKMTRAKSPWSSIDMSALRFSLSDRKKRVVYFYGFKPQELKDIGVGRVASCSSDPGIQFSSEVPREFFEGDAQAPFYGNSELERRLGKPLIAMILPFENIDVSMGEKVKLPVVLSNMMVHEDFHGQQSSGENSYPPFPARFAPTALSSHFPPSEPSLCNQKTGYGCRIPGACLKSSKWLEEIRIEMNDLQGVQDRWAALSMADLKKIASKLVARRGDGSEDALEKKCWNGIRDVERVEGTANYFAGALGRNAKIAGADEMTLLKVAGPYRITNRNMFVSGLEFFYVSGAVLCRMMDRIDPSGKWQERIQKGMPIDLALRNLLESAP